MTLQSTDLWKSIEAIRGRWHESPAGIGEEEIAELYTLFIRQYQRGWDDGYYSFAPTPLAALEFGEETE